MMHYLVKQLLSNEAVLALSKKLNTLGNLSICEEALLYSALFAKEPRQILIVKNNAYEVIQLYERMACLMDEVMMLNMEDSLRVEAIASSPEQKAIQMETMAKLSSDEPFVCIMNLAAAVRYVPSPSLFRQCFIHIKQDDIQDYEQLKQSLFLAGYLPVKRVDQPLTYASRGGIIDVYSINYDHPIRIEFFDNEIESIRFFDISTQRTIETLKEVTIVPADSYLFADDEISELVSVVNEEFQKQKDKLDLDIAHQLESQINDDLDAIANHEMQNHFYRYYTYLNNRYTIFDYVKDPFVILSNVDALKSKYRSMNEELILYIQELFQEGKGLLTFHHFATLEESLKQIRPVEIQEFVDYKKPIQSQLMPVLVHDMTLEKSMETILANIEYKRIVFVLKQEEQDRVKDYLDVHEIPYRYFHEDEDLQMGITLMEGHLYEGYMDLSSQLEVYTAKELFNHVTRITKYSDKFKNADMLSSYEELQIGDFVVHNQYGIGKYLGIITRKVNGIHKDYLHIAYHGDSILDVPLENFKMIRKFVSKEGNVPRLSKLGTNEWEKKKQKVYDNVEQLAGRLVELYSQRQEDIGFAFSPDGDEQRAFEADFPYRPTIDQLQAIIEMKKDMESSKPMDRLLCGDVGFGKTEVAAVGAFKAVMDGKQVAYLCPTTILSFQHFKTFQKRFENFPVTIEVINRFVNTAKQKEIIQKLKEGKIDILIGTHRLLSKQLEFKDLGFLIIDEEQRFGVEHKEKIKELKTGVDVLSLSATPIPRTLQMSLIGIRSLSQLNTPPSNRMPVQTYLIEKNDNMIKEVISRELARSGQVFYLYNSVSDIYSVARKLKKAFPDVEIGVAHGQMSREEIEDVMMRFTANEYQILVCTTIIETGIDIPNANTILIDQANKFGLSQLYQIKGRVGRSDRLAYAYLMYDPNRQLSELAMKRLKTIKEFTQLGSGYKVAMRDLTIRGAGDLLGPKQAGFIDTVGIDMYIEMLNDAIAARKGIVKEAPKELKKSGVKVDAYIPEQFANEDYEKIRLYQRIEKITDKKELAEVIEDIIDNYGTLPKSVKMLFEKKRLDILLNESYVEGFEENDRMIKIQCTKHFSQYADGVKLFDAMNQVSREIQIRFHNGFIYISLPKKARWLPTLIKMLEELEIINPKA